MTTSMDNVEVVSQYMDDEVHGVSEEMAPSNAFPLSLLLKAEKLGGTPLPSFIFITDSIAEMCYRGDIPRPIHISMLNEFEYILAFPVG